MNRYCDWCKQPRPYNEIEELIIKPGRAVKDSLTGKHRGWQGRKVIKACRECKPIVERQLALGPAWAAYESNMRKAVNGT